MVKLRRRSSAVQELLIAGNTVGEEMEKHARKNLHLAAAAAAPGSGLRGIATSRTGLGGLPHLRSRSRVAAARRPLRPRWFGRRADRRRCDWRS
ncbi:unnamed protein product [Urochloa humidicola]